MTEMPNSHSIKLVIELWYSWLVKSKEQHGNYFMGHVDITPTNAEVCLIDKPDDPTIFVALNRV